MAVEQRQRLRIEIGDAEIADAAFALFATHPVGNRRRLQMRVETVQHQRVDTVRMQRGQGGVERSLQMVGRQIVMMHAAWVARAAGHHDAYLRDQPEPRAQPRAQCERGADQRIGGVSAVDIGQIERVDAEVERGFQQIGHGLRRQLRAPFAEAHRAEDRAAGRGWIRHLRFSMAAGAGRRDNSGMTQRTLSDWLDYIQRQHPKTIAMGLERVRTVAEAMSLPKPARHVITVGGTNGKGSTVAFVEAIARAAGWRVGAYTSPHLLHYNERVRIDGEDVDDASLVVAFEAVEAARGDVALTYFEYGTLAALWLFAGRGLDLAILEVGLGGRLDAVNLIDPDVAVITTVDLDHQDWLGDTVEAIGREKVGIARAWKPLVLGDDDPPSSVLGHAYAIGASAVRIGCDFFFERIEDDRQHWRWHEIGCELMLPMPQLAAPVQLRNAAVAIAALRALAEDLPEAAFIAGVRDAQVAARLQRFMRDGVEIVVDVAHNPQAARALAAWLEASPAAGPTHAVFAALGDKDIAGVIDALAERVDRWWLAGLTDAGPRGLTAAAFAAGLAGTAAAAGSLHADVVQALDAARAEAAPGARILVFGSFHTAAHALAALADA